MMSTVSASMPTQQAIAEYLGQGGYDAHLKNCVSSWSSASTGCCMPSANIFRQM